MIDIHDSFEIADLGQLAFRRGSQLLDAREILHDAEKLEKPATFKLDVKGPASNSGTLINLRAYPGTKIRNAVPSWTQDYNNPILINHNEKGECIGRITDAAFFSFVSEDELINDWQNLSKRGSGELYLKGYVAGKENVEKVLDRRYSTISVGAKTNALSCSVCSKNWIRGRCAHRPGSFVRLQDSDQLKLAYLVSGDIVYKELSFVNKPASGTSYMGFEDSVQEFLLDSFSTIEDSVRETFLPQSSPLILDTLTINDQEFDVINIQDREVIEVHSEPKNITPKEDEMSQESTDVQVDDTLQAQPDEADASSIEDSGSTDEDLMADETKTQELDELKDKLSIAQGEIADKEAKIASLVTENAELSDKLQTMLAETLVDLRVAKGFKLPEVEEGDARAEEVKRFSGRTRDSLQDAIADLRDFEVPVVEVVEEAPNVERGSVTEDDAGVLSDNEMDAPAQSKSDKKSFDSRSAASAYKNKIFGALRA